MPPGYILDDSRKLYKQLVSTASFGDPGRRFDGLVRKKVREAYLGEILHSQF